MTHLGSSTDRGPKEALEKVIEGVEKILNGYTGSTQFLIEMSAGAGNIIGDTFEEIAKIIKALPQFDIGVCLDTCHAFVSGYDLHTQRAVEGTFEKFDKAIGLSRLKLIHANDAKNAVGSHLDRHEHIGYGKIGKEGFYALMHYAVLADVDFILETPPGGGQDVNDLKMLKELRK
jgi:deoxyribonuclease-4